MDEQHHEYLMVGEVAEVLRIARGRAYELVGSGEIPSVRIGRSVRVSRKELDRWLESPMTLGWALATSRLNIVRTVGGLVAVRNAKQISCLVGRNRR